MDGKKEPSWTSTHHPVDAIAAIVAFAGGVLGFVLIATTGISALVPIAMAVVIAGLCYVGADSRWRPMIGAFSVQVGLVAMLVIGAVLQEKWAVVAFDLVILISGLCWLALQPRLGAVVLLSAYQLLGLGTDCVIFLAQPSGEGMRVVPTVYIALRAYALVAMWAGELVILSRLDREPEKADKRSFLPAITTLGLAVATALLSLVFALLHTFNHGSIWLSLPSIGCGVAALTSLIVFEHMHSGRPPVAPSAIVYVGHYINVISVLVVASIVVEAINARNEKAAQARSRNLRERQGGIDPARNSDLHKSVPEKVDGLQRGDHTLRPQYTALPPAIPKPKHEFRSFRSDVKPEKSEDLPAKLVLAKATENDFTITSLDLIQNLRSGVAAWSPRGDRLMLEDENNRLVEISLPEWIVCRRLSATPRQSILAWSEKSLLLGAFTRLGTWSVTDLASDTLTGRLTVQFSGVAQACASLQPPRLFLGDAQGETIKIFDLDLQKTVLAASRAELAKARGLAVDRPHSGSGRLAVTPDGKWLLNINRNRMECYAVDSDKLILQQAIPRPVTLKGIVTGVEANSFAALAQQVVSNTPQSEWQFYRMTDLEHCFAVVGFKPPAAAPALVPESGEILTMNTEGFAVCDPLGKVKRFLPWSLMARTIRAGRKKPGFVADSTIFARIYAHPEGRGSLIVTEHWSLWIEWKAREEGGTRKGG